MMGRGGLKAEEPVKECLYHEGTGDQLGSVEYRNSATENLRLSRPALN